MSIEVQVRESTLTRAVSDAVQERLYYTCLPSAIGNYVDHVDVSKRRPPKLAPSGGGTLRLRMWLDVYIVTGQQLSGSAYGVPQGATTRGPTGRDLCRIHVG